MFIYPHLQVDVSCLSTWTLLVLCLFQSIYYSFRHLMMRPSKSETKYNWLLFPYHLAWCHAYGKRQKFKAFWFSVLSLLLVFLTLTVMVVMTVVMVTGVMV